MYNNVNLDRSKITDEKFDELLVNTKYKYLQKFFNKINELRKIKYRADGMKKRKIIKGEYTKLLNA